MAVFKVNSNFDVIINADAIRLVPELVSLSKDELMYVVLVADYVDGPYRKKPIEERVLMAKKRVWGKDDPKVDNKKITMALEVYKSLVFDIRRETIDIYNSKIRTLQKETLQPSTSFARMKEIDSTISFMMDRISNISHELDIEDGEEIELKGKKKMSYLEIWQRNQKMYHEYKSNL